VELPAKTGDVPCGLYDTAVASSLMSSFSY